MRYIVQGTRCVSGPVMDGFIVESVPSFYVEASDESNARCIARLVVTGESSVAGKKYGKGLNTVHTVFKCHVEAVE